MRLLLKHITPLFSLLILSACSQPTEEPSSSEPTEEQAASAPKEKITICFVGHQTSHGFGKHEYMAGCHLIEDWLDEAYPETEIEGRYAVPGRKMRQPSLPMPMLSFSSAREERDTS